MCTNKLETKLNVLLINYSFIHFAKNSCGLKYIFFSLAYWTVLQLQKKVSVQN